MDWRAALYNYAARAATDKRFAGPMTPDSGAGTELTHGFWESMDPRPLLEAGPAVMDLIAGTGDRGARVGEAINTAGEMVSHPIELTQALAHLAKERPWYAVGALGATVLPMPGDEEENLRKALERLRKSIPLSPEEAAMRAGTHYDDFTLGGEKVSNEALQFGADALQKAARNAERRKRVGERKLLESYEGKAHEGAPLWERPLHTPAVRVKTDTGVRIFTPKSEGPYYLTRQPGRQTSHGVGDVPIHLDALAEAKKELGVAFDVKYPTETGFVDKLGRFISHEEADRSIGRYSESTFMRHLGQLGETPYPPGNPMAESQGDIIAKFSKFSNEDLVRQLGYHSPTFNKWERTGISKGTSPEGAAAYFKWKAAKDELTRRGYRGDIADVEHVALEGAPLSSARGSAPDWVLEAMRAQGKNPNRIMNEVDFAQYQNLVENDPMIAELAKSNPELAARARRGDITRDELLTFLKPWNTSPSLGNAPENAETMGDFKAILDQQPNFVLESIRRVLRNQGKQAENELLGHMLPPTAGEVPLREKAVTDELIKRGWRGDIADVEHVALEGPGGALNQYTELRAKKDKLTDLWHQAMAEHRFKDANNIQKEWDTASAALHNEIKRGPLAGIVSQSDIGGDLLDKLGIQGAKEFNAEDEYNAAAKEYLLNSGFHMDKLNNVAYLKGPAAELVEWRRGPKGWIRNPDFKLEDKPHLSLQPPDFQRWIKTYEEAHGPELTIDALNKATKRENAESWVHLTILPKLIDGTASAEEVVWYNLWRMKSNPPK